MRSSFGHIGDFVEAMKETYDKCPDAKTKERLVEIVDSMCYLAGDVENLRAYWPEQQRLMDRINNPRGLQKP